MTTPFLTSHRDESAEQVHYLDPAKANVMPIRCTLCDTKLQMSLHVFKAWTTHPTLATC